MPRIYAYVDGSDLHEVEGMLLKKFRCFSESWGIESAQVVNEKYPRTSDLAPEDFPDWYLGLNFEFESLPRDKIEALVEFLASIADETDREFVIGAYHQATGATEDWCFIGPEIKPETVEFLVGQLQ